MRVLITGSTTWTDRDAIRRELAKLPQEATIVHGDCEGADAIAGELAVQLGLAVERWDKTEADYQRYRRAAWKGLNERMLASGVVLVLAFHPEWNVEGKARGTKHAMQLAKAAGLAVQAFAS